MWLQCVQQITLYHTSARNDDQHHTLPKLSSKQCAPAKLPDAIKSTLRSVITYILIQLAVSMLHREAVNKWTNNLSQHLYFKGSVLNRDFILSTKPSTQFLPHESMLWHLHHKDWPVKVFWGKKSLFIVKIIHSTNKLRGYNS
jgi:hypothetical protein